MKVLLLSLAGLVLIAVLAGGYLWFASRQFGAKIGGLVDALTAEQQAAGTDAPGLPAILRDYAVRAGGRVGGATLVYAKQTATLAIARDASPIAIAAEQWMGVTTPGLVWRATGSMNGVPVTVLDAFVAGRGELSARVLGALQVAGGTGADYDKGELMRYLAELPFYPDAILGNAAIAWRQLDERTVEATAQSRAGPATVRFTFDAAGDIVEMRADDRPMSTEGGRTVPTPWQGSFSNYAQLGRYRIPTHGEVGWALPDGFFTYWRGTITAYEPLE